MAESDQGPPRLPDPPPQDSPFGYSPGAGGINYSLQQTMNTQYLPFYLLNHNMV